jgi:hypothetical protein
MKSHYPANRARPLFCGCFTRTGRLICLICLILLPNKNCLPQLDAVTLLQYLSFDRKEGGRNIALSQERRLTRARRRAFPILPSRRSRERVETVTVKPGVELK